MPTWCEHPREDLQRIYTPALTIYTDRLLCGLCGELIFLPDPWLRAEKPPAPAPKDRRS